MAATETAKRVFKSKKKLSGGRCVYRPWKEWETGDLIIGKYKGNKTDNYEKPNWLVEVIDAQFSKQKEAKKLLPKDGASIVIGLNSAGQLDKAMENVEEGDMIQVMYNGTSQIEKGKYKGKDAHLIEVDLVEEEGEEFDEAEDSDEVDDRDEDEDDDSEDDL